MKLNTTYPGQKIIGLAGYAGVGKDTVAEYLGLPKTSFAKALKEDVTQLLLRLDLDINNRDDKSKARDLLVAYGALARSVDPDFWIKRLTLPSSPAVVITDVRYLNEVKAIEEAGGSVYWIVRTGTYPANDEEADSFNAIIEAMAGGEVKVASIRNHENFPHVAASEIRTLASLETGDFEYDEAVKNTEKNYDGYWNLAERPGDPGCWEVRGDDVYYRDSTEYGPPKKGIWPVKEWIDNGEVVRSEWLPEKPLVLGGGKSYDGYWNIGTSPSHPGCWKVRGEKVTFIDQFSYEGPTHLTRDTITGWIDEEFLVPSKWLPVADLDKCGTTDGVTPLPDFSDFVKVEAVNAKDTTVAAALESSINSSPVIEQVKEQVAKDTLAYILYGKGGPCMVIPEELEDDLRNIAGAKQGDVVAIGPNTMDFIINSIPIVKTQGLSVRKTWDEIEDSFWCPPEQPRFNGIPIEYVPSLARSLPYYPMAAIITRDGLEFASEITPKPPTFSELLQKRREEAYTSLMLSSLRDLTTTTITPPVQLAENARIMGDSIWDRLTIKKATLLDRARWKLNRIKSRLSKFFVAVSDRIDPYRHEYL